MSIYDKAQKLAAKLIPKFANPDSLVFEEEASVPDGYGGYSTTWATKFTCQGAVLPLSGGEQLKAMQLNEESTHKAYVQVSSGTPLAIDRLSFKGKTYNITNVLNIAEADAVYTVMLKSGVVT